VVFHDLGYHYNVSVATVYSVPVTAWPDSQAIRQAILVSGHETIHGHPCLSLQVCESAKGQYFVCLCLIQISSVVEFRHVEVDGGGD
jgi:hypothetical protein